jgi:hypothetical protein
MAVIHSTGQAGPSLKVGGHSIGLADRAFVELVALDSTRTLYKLADVLALAEQIEPRGLAYIAEILNSDTVNRYLHADDAATWASHKARVSELLGGVEVCHA